MTVYYLRAGNGAIKIGYSSNTNKRFSSISTASPLELELVAQEEGGLKLEKKRHEQFKSDSIRGEWFYPSRTLNKHIKKLNGNYHPMPYVDHVEYYRLSEKEEKLREWFATDRSDPPKIGLVVATAGLLVVPLLHLITQAYPNPSDGSISVVSMIVSPIFLFVLAGYILVKVWQLRVMWRDVRKDVNRRK